MSAQGVLRHAKSRVFVGGSHKQLIRRRKPRAIDVGMRLLTLGGDPRSGFIGSANSTHFTLQNNASCSAQISVPIPYEVASLRGESSNRLLETLEEWNDYLER
jgi:hypothetical protein